MRISIFGLGYVGAVSAGCLARDGHDVIGVDPLPAKLDLIRQGQSPIIEADIGEIIASAIRSGRLSVSEDPVEGVHETELSFICVGTPSQPNGNLDLKYVRRVSEEIGRALRTKSSRHLVVVRSTIVPGTMRSEVIPVLEEFSLKRAGKDFDVCFNPEFLREGTSVEDFRSPPKTVIGELEPGSGDLLTTLFSGIDAPLIRTELETAEMIKYVDNCWHALKIGFANEIGNVSKSFGIDAHEVMNIFCQDAKLNISPAYLRPGFAFGGSCLPKDLRALSYTARARDLELPILSSILPSNELQVARALQLVMAKGNKRVGVLGFSFKEGTDDLRESPVIELIERLIGKGYDLRLYDKNVSLSRLVGANREFILKLIPHISRLMVDSLDAALDHGQTIVIGNKDPDFREVPDRLREDQVLVDLVRVSSRTSDDKGYEGICW